MKELNELKRDLANYERELASITKEIKKDTPFPLHALDGHSESYIVTSYTDESKAKYLKGQINYLKEQIDSYSHDAETIRRVQARKEQEDQEWRETQITHNANVLYEEKIEAYMAMNFWGKAKTLFAGKKPKKLNQQEIIQKYGSEAVEQVIGPARERLIIERDAQIERAKKDFINEPKQLEYAIKAINQYYETKITQGQVQYNKTLDNLQGDRSR